MFFNLSLVPIKLLLGANQVEAVEHCTMIKRDGNEPFHCRSADESTFSLFALLVLNWEGKSLSQTWKGPSHIIIVFCVGVELSGTRGTAKRSSWVLAYMSCQSQHSILHFAIQKKKKSILQFQPYHCHLQPTTCAQFTYDLYQGHLQPSPMVGNQWLNWYMLHIKASLLLNNLILSFSIKLVGLLLSFQKLLCH